MTPKKKRIVLGTRGSALALWQTDHVHKRLQDRFPDLEIEREIIRTTGDRHLDKPLAQIGSKSLFTKEIEDALLDGRIDMAVHSLKDLPTEIPRGLQLGAVLKRGSPRDAFISKSGAPLAEVPKGATLATGSLRRGGQLLHHRPDLQIVDLRGNVETRLRKLRENDWAGIILAEAGLQRLGLDGVITELVHLDIMLPAIGQGAIAVEIRSNDKRVQCLAEALADHDTTNCVIAERAFLHRLEGGCQVPVGALGVMEQGELTLHGAISSPDGRSQYRGQLIGATESAESLGRELADRLLEQGGKKILDEIRKSERIPAIQETEERKTANRKTQPLKGIRVIVTRAPEKATETAEMLRAEGAEPILLPMIEILPPESWEEFDRAVSHSNEYDWIILTSANGAKAFLERMQSLGVDKTEFSSLKFACVGKTTAKVLEVEGISVDLVPEDSRAEGLAKNLLESEDLKGKRILLLQANIARSVLKQELRNRCALVDAIVAYRTVPAQIEPEEISRLLGRGEVQWVLLTSSSTASNFCTQIGNVMGKDWLSNLKFASIGPVTSKTLEALGLKPDVESDERNIVDLVQRIIEYETDKEK